MNFYLVTINFSLHIVTKFEEHDEENVSMIIIS